MRKSLVLATLFVFFLLHQDFWFWDDGWLVLGLPIGYLYHIGYCLAAACVMLVVTRAR